MNLKEKAKLLPEKAGVYLMKDAMDHIVYVGKSKNLRQRVKQYFQNNKAHSPKVVRMMGVVKDFQYIVTDTELEALVLECRLIKEIKPFYNRLMKNDQGYVYICLSMEKHTKLSVVYDPEGYDRCFGPFTKRSMAEQILELIHKYYSVRRCSSHSERKREGCLNYQLNNCLGPCREDTDPEAYSQEIERAVSFLEGRDSSLLTLLQEKMMEAAARQEYHKAAIYRDELAVANMLKKRQKALGAVEDIKDILAMERIDEKQVKAFFIRDYRLWQKRRISLDGKSIEAVIEELREFIYPQLKKRHKRERKPLEHEAIDEAQILYHYLQGKRKNLFSLHLPIKLPKEGNNSKLERDLRKLVDKLHLQSDHS
ncbi:excinuclease ABC subunit C [Geosporobacter subterraneus DSM 17957]|uniref:Excinuclease ABC subunit C n=1 Tax=Geosporobacter subterraneus DSM 17957 TaxID=1121919 RepID=A0A1M6F5V6_9FIRM|nr:GIY-YIG nuclease family protein [Geosporobacter subterraneus]SHI93053.1 excinuclease ABC subunit C [Geosporobacter subterraneus DSM 17957]